MKRIRGAIGIGLTWAAGWAVAGVLIGVSSILFPALPWDTFFSAFDAPLPTLAIPGFFGGIIFSIVLGIAARRKRLDEMSVTRFGAYGALGGLLLSLLPAAIVALGLGSAEGSAITQWQFIAAISGPCTILSAASAIASLMLARRGAQGELDEAREVAALTTLGEQETLVFRGGLVHERVSRADRAAHKP